MLFPIIGKGLAKACEQQGSAWLAYLEDLVREARTNSNVAVFPYCVDRDAMNGTQIASLLGEVQLIAPSAPAPGDNPAGQRCRDLVQGMTQFLSANDQERLKVFISHTKRNNPEEAENVGELIALVRAVIGETRLTSFFDAQDLQPGTDWEHVLEAEAARSALLAIRTDLFPSREWCQREVSISKRAGMPLVILDSLGYAEERGSFLMDHVPRVAARKEQGHWRREDIYGALNLLVDECLKRSVWNHQRRLGEPVLETSWWAPHAPEPLTLVDWLGREEADASNASKDRFVRIIHPDPPLGPAEMWALEQILRLSGRTGELDILTPRQLAARGG
ncbi:MAG: hypothetical protein V7741_00215 [Hyphomonas sp.]